MKNVPNEIFLHIGEDTPSDADFNELDEVTWSSEANESNAIRYIREDVAAAQFHNRYQTEVSQLYIDKMGIRNLFFRWFHASGELTSELCKFAGADEEVEILEIMERIAQVAGVIKNIAVAFGEDEVWLMEFKQWFQLDYYLRTHAKKKEE